MADFRETALGQEILTQAASLYSPVDDLDVSVDRNTIMYHNDEDGYWVLSWCFVPDEKIATVEEAGQDVQPVIINN